MQTEIDLYFTAHTYQVTFLQSSYDTNNWSRINNSQLKCRHLICLLCGQFERIYDPISLLAIARCSDVVGCVQYVQRRIIYITKDLGSMARKKGRILNMWALLCHMLSTSVSHSTLYLNSWSVLSTAFMCFVLFTMITFPLFFHSYTVKWLICP